MQVCIGDIVPTFKGKDQNGNQFNASDIIGKKVCVLFFYPKDFTPGCTKEVCNFRDHYEEFKEMGAEIIGISGDSQSSHNKFAAKYGLPFTLVSDDNGTIRKKLNVKRNLLGLIPGRETFVIDKNGVVQMRFNNLDANRHLEKALKKVKELIN